jgi:hypothetical protein
VRVLALALLLIALIAATHVSWHAPRRNPPPLGEEMPSQSRGGEGEARVFGAQPAAPSRSSVARPAAPARPRLGAPTAPSRAPTIEGSVLDPDTGDTIAWGTDASGDDLVLIIPRNPADIDNDGRIDPADALRMIESLTSSDPRADLNADGVTNAHDLATFWNAFLRPR